MNDIFQGLTDIKGITSNLAAAAIGGAAVTLWLRARKFTSAAKAERKRIENFRENHGISIRQTASLIDHLPQLSIIASAQASISAVRDTLAYHRANFFFCLIIFASNLQSSTWATLMWFIATTYMGIRFGREQIYLISLNTAYMEGLADANELAAKIQTTPPPGQSTPPPQQPPAPTPPPSPGSPA